MLKITYELTGRGWAECYVSNKDENITITASYLDDALDSLLSACLFLTQGARETHASFAEEPGEYRWLFTNIGSDEIIIAIIEFDKLWGNKSDEEGREIFKIQCTLKDLIKALIQTLTDLLDRYGEKGYKKEWVNHDFPMQKYLLLKIWLHDK